MKYLVGLCLLVAFGFVTQVSSLAQPATGTTAQPSGTASTPPPLTGPIGGIVQPGGTVVINPTPNPNPHIAVHIGSTTGTVTQKHFRMSDYTSDLIPYDPNGVIVRDLFVENISSVNIDLGTYTPMSDFPNMTYSGGSTTIAPGQFAQLTMTIACNPVGRFWEMYTLYYTPSGGTQKSMMLTTDPKITPPFEGGICPCCPPYNNAELYANSKEPENPGTKLASGGRITEIPLLDLGERGDSISKEGGSPSSFTIYQRSDIVGWPTDLESGFLGESMRDSFDMAIVQDDGLRARIYTPDMRQYLVTRTSGATPNWDLPVFFFSDLTLDTANNEWELTHFRGTRFVFDAPGALNGPGLLKSFTDTNGNTTTIIRDASGRKDKIINDLGYEINFTYDGNNRISQIQDTYMRTWILQYDAQNRLQFIHLPAAANTVDVPVDTLIEDGGGTSFDSIGGGFSSQILTRTIEYEYSSTLPNHVTSIVDGRGVRPWIITYDTDGTVLRKSINGNNVEYYYDLQLSMAGVPGPNALGVLDAGNTITRIVDREGNICDYEIHGELGDSSSGGQGKFGLRRKICWTEAGKGNTPLRAGEPLYWETRYFHDCDCLAPKQVSQPFRNDASITFDTITRMPTNYPHEEFVYNSNRQITDYQYIGFTSSENIRWTATYQSSNPAINEFGQRESYTPPRAFDDNTSIYPSSGPTQLSFTHTYTYDNFGNMKTHTFPTVERGTSVEDPMAAIESWDYNSFGQLTKYTDENGNETDYEYFTSSSSISTINTPGNFEGFLKSVTVGANDPMVSLQTQYRVNALGWLLETTDPKGFVHTTEYNNLQEVTKRTQPSVTLPEISANRIYETHYFHDETGNVLMTSRTNIDSDGANYVNPFINSSTSYDIVSNVTATSVEVDQNSGNDLTTEYAYDDNDQLIVVQQPEGNRTFTVYDERRLGYKTFYGVEPGASITTGYPATKTATSLTVDHIGFTRTDYDARYNTTLVKDGRGNTMTSFYDFRNRTLAIRDQNGNGMRYEYDDGSFVLSTQGGRVNTSGNISLLLERSYHRYDERGRRYQTVMDINLGTNETTHIDPDGNDDQIFSNSVNSSYLTFYDKGNRVTFSEDAENNQTGYTYDAANRTETATDELSNVVTYEYDDNSNVTTITESEFFDVGGSQEDYVTTHSYDQLNRRIETHILGLDDGSTHIDHVTRFFYDSANYTRKVEDAEDGFPTLTGGRITESIRDDLMRTTETRRYDEDNGAIIIRNRFVYDENSRKIQDKAYTNAAAASGEQITQYGYDHLNRLTMTVYPDSDDVISNSAAVTPNPQAGEEGFINAPVGSNGSDGNFDRVEVVYDPNNNVVSVKEQREVLFDNTYDDGNRLTRQDITLAGSVVGETRRDFIYDQLNRISFARNNYAEVQRLYDPLSRLTNEFQSVKLDGTGFTGNSWAHEIELESGYDRQSNRLTMAVEPGATPDLTVTSTYDDLNRKDTISAGYFGLTRNNLADYDYHGPWRVRNKTYANGAVETRLYDAKRRVRESRWNDASVSQNVLTGFQYGTSQTNESLMGYDKVDNPLNERWLHDRASMGAGAPLSDNYDYNERYEVTGVNYRDISATDYRGFVGAYSSFYNYDDNFNRTSADFADPFGNTGESVSDTGYMVTDANEYTAFSRDTGSGATPVAPSHDRAGNMTGIPLRPASGNEAGNDITATATYDAFNRIFDITPNSNTQQHYRCDAFGRRIATMEVSGSSITDGRRYIYDGWSVVTEQTFDGGATLANASSTLERIYVNGKDIDEPLLAAIDGNTDGDLNDNKNSTNGMRMADAEYYYLANRMGSIAALLDADDDERVLEYYRYSIYGEAVVLPIVDTSPVDGLEDTPLSLADNNTLMIDVRNGPDNILGNGDDIQYAGRISNFGNTYMYTARRLDEQTGLHYYRYRYYEARMGRFVGRDPAEVPGNLYSYCLNHVSSQADPTGLVAPAIPAAVAAWGITEVVAATFGLTALACLLDSDCARAVANAIAEAVEELVRPAPPPPQPKVEPRRKPAPKPKPKPEPRIPPPIVERRAPDKVKENTYYRYYPSDNCGKCDEPFKRQKNQLVISVWVTTVGTYSPEEAQNKLGLPPDNKADCLAKIKCKKAEYGMWGVKTHYWEPIGGDKWRKHDTIEGELPEGWVKREGGGTEGLIPRNQIGLGKNCEVISKGKNTNGAKEEASE